MVINGFKVAQQNCGTCALEGNAANAKECKRCYNRDDYRGWQPKAGIVWYHSTDSRGKQFLVPKLPKEN